MWYLESWFLAQVSYHKTVFNFIYWHFNLSVLYCSELSKRHHSKLFLQYHLEATCLLTSELNCKSLCTHSILQCWVTPYIKSPVGLLCHWENATICSAKRRLLWKKLLFFKKIKGLWIPWFNIELHCYSRTCWSAQNKASSYIYIYVYAYVYTYIHNKEYQSQSFFQECNYVKLLSLFTSHSHAVCNLLCLPYVQPLSISPKTFQNFVSVTFGLKTNVGFLPKKKDCVLRDT